MPNPHDAKLHNPPAAWQAKEDAIIGECGKADVSRRELTGTAAEAKASGGDAKLALVIPRGDPLRLPAWNFTFAIENQRRLASAAMRCPREVIVAARLSPAMRGS
jgi:hypothetical protein